MWSDKDLLETITMFLPPTSKIILFETPYKRPAAELIDLDGDNILEIVGAYYWHGEIYIIILKYYDNAWHVLNTVKGKGYNITYFDAAPIVNKYKNNTEEACKSIDKALASEYPYPSIEKLMHLKERICKDRQLFNQHGIDFSSIKYIPSETKRDIQLEKALVKAFDLSQDEDNVRYYYNKVDLNDDGNPEVFVYLVGSPFCGTGGCSAVIFKQENGNYKLLSRFSLVRNPVIISNKKTSGYKDIIMYVSGGGIESFFAQIKYDGTTYPSNPSIQSKVEPGTKVEGMAIVADDIAKNPGMELKDFRLVKLRSAEF